MSRKAFKGREEHIGHERVLAPLYRAAENDGLHHAYLLEGPSGVGKRQVADLLALTVNCTAEKRSARPCGRCNTCRTIRGGTHPDVVVLEPDPKKASASIPVDAVREVIRQAGYHRYGARRRVVIVDPAEAMAESAANALLKTLEEPPAGTGFFLVTHNAQALLPTIRSRCQRVRLGAVPTSAIVRWLEARKTDDAEVLAQLALGCPGRALELSGKGLAARAKLRSQLFEVLHGPIDDVFGFSQALCKGARVDYGRKVDALLHLVEDLLRDVVVIGAGGDAGLLNADADQDVRGMARRLYPDGVLRCAEAVQDARDQLAIYVSGRLVVDGLLCRIRHALGR